MEKPIVFFIGKPGSGKGTQAQLLSEVTHWPVVGTSGGLREIVATGTAAGRKLKETMDAGILTPYWVATYVYLKILLNIPDDGNVIFDGTSRTSPEAEIVAESLTWLGRPFRIFHLTVPDDVVHERISLRRQQGTRADDAAHVVVKRLEEYYESTEGAIDYLRTKGLLTDIDGHRPPEVVAKEVRDILGLS